MKIRSVCQCCLLLVSQVCLGFFVVPCRGDDVAATENVLVNGGLEGDLDPATGLPVGWEVTQSPPNSYKVEVVDGGRTGKKCLRISGEGKNVQVRMKHLPMAADHRSVVSGWIKVTGGEGVVSLMHRYQDANGRRLNSTSIGGVNAAGGVDWLQTAMFEQPRLTQPGASSNFIINAGGKIDALIDDLEVFTLAVTPDDVLWCGGDFEGHYGRSLAPAYRSATSQGGTVTVSLDDKLPSNGRYCLRLKANAEWATMTMWPVKYDASKVYTLTGKVRINSGKASIRIDYYKDENRTNLLGSSVAPITESKDWQTLTVDTSKNSYAEATHITATAVCYDNADAFFDQFSMLEK